MIRCIGSYGLGLYKSTKSQTMLLVKYCNIHKSASRKLYDHQYHHQQNQSQEHTTTLNDDEVRKFENMASTWWSQGGPMKELHSMNKLRVPLIRDGISSQNHQAPTESPKPLSGYLLLDIGCGGGILTEPLGRLGASITGIDPGKENIMIAESHLPMDLKNNVKYECCTIEQFVKSYPEKLFDGVISSETIEHVENQEQFLKLAIQCIKPGGSLFLTTLNRTLESWIGAIVSWEYVLRKLPIGTHNWNKFLRPEELQSLLNSLGCRVKLTHGMCYNPVTNTWNWSRSPAINYCVHATK